MTIEHLKTNDYTISQWSGGTTTQLAIFPSSSVYADRDFLWRVSSATVELEESDFTPLPDYTRYISILNGTMTLQHNGSTPYSVLPGQSFCFDGADFTHSWGKCTDFNLMLRKGVCCGKIQQYSLCSEGLELALNEEADTLLLYSCTGEAVVIQDGNSISLFPGECALISGKGTVILVGNGIVMSAWIHA